MIVAQGSPRRDQIGDQVGEADVRGDFQRAFGVDQLVGRDGVLVEETGGGVGEFGGDAEETAVFRQLPRPCPQISHRLHWRLLRRGQIERAGAKAQSLVKRQDGPVAVQVALLGDDVQAGDAKINAALPHANDDVARPLEQHRHARQRRDGRLVLARIGPVHLQAAVCQ